MSRCCPTATSSRSLAGNELSADNIGSAAVTDRHHVKHLHSKVLTQTGLDPDKLTHFYGGLDQKLEGVESAEPIRQII